MPASAWRWNTAKDQYAVPYRDAGGVYGRGAEGNLQDREKDSRRVLRFGQNHEAEVRRAARTYRGCRARGVIAGGLCLPEPLVEVGTQACRLIRRNGRTNDPTRQASQTSRAGQGSRAGQAG